jgi:1-acyl-sn-glycerol-3-phosphate acyltransferase
MLRLMGWRVENAPPDLPKMVIVVAPHTSNWDFPVGVAAMFALDLAPRWFGKHTLFRGPFGGLLRRIGGLPVRRHGGGASGNEGVVEQVVAAFAAADRFALALSPEGTRGRVARWKSGYYVIAEAAGVPVVPAWLDWSRRVVGFGAPARAEGGAEAMSARLAASFHPRMARRPDAY